MIAEQIRKSILQAAIQGKLTEQLPTDGNARSLLKKIRAEKSKLVSDKKIKAEKKLPEITDEEIPFDIPENWCWVRLGDVCQVKGGKRLPVGHKLTRNDTGHKFIRVTDMREGTIIDHDIHFVPEDIYPKIKNYIITSDDIYITCAGTIGRVGIVPEKFDGANLTENADRLIPIFLSKYCLRYFLNSEFVQEQIREFTTKVGQPKLAIKKIESILIPLPPLPEQIRIVEKLNELLSEVDGLEHDERELMDLEKIFSRKLRNSILQAAIQGKLTKQLPTDGNARSLLKKIRAEKSKLVSDKKIKAEKKLPDISEEEIPFEIPENWCWVRLGDVCQINPRNKPNDENIDATFLPMTSISDGYRDDYISIVKPWNEIKNGFTHFADGDVVFAKITPCFQNRKSATMKNLKNGIGAGTTEIFVLRPYGKLVHEKYLLHFVKNQLFIKDGLATMRGTAGQQRISRSFVSNYLFPLPPLAEQIRIVEKLHELLSEVDDLENIL